MRAQIVADVIRISVAPVTSLLHQNHIGINYVGTSNSRMEPIRSMSFFSLAMPRSIIIVTEPPFVSSPIHIVDGVRSRTQTLRTTEFVNLHEDILGEVNKIFANQPLNLGGGDSDPPGPPRPPRYFGVAMVNQASHHYHQTDLMVSHLTIWSMLKILT
jgi:hypothetical protein